MKWEVKRLGDICSTGAGGTPLKNNREYYEGGNIPWLLSGEVNRREIDRAQNFITEVGLKNSSAKLFPPNTVLIAMYGATAGQVGILRFESATNQAVCGILPNDRTVPEYLYYCFLAKKDELVAQAVGGAQPNISQIKIKDTVIPLPPLSEQRRIVAILDEAFAGIAKAKEAAEKNRLAAREIFEAELEKIFREGGEGWEEKTLQEVSTTFGRGRSRHRPRNEPKLYGGPYPFVQTGEVRNCNHFITEYTQTYSELGLAQSKLWPKGTICITIAANIAETGVLAFDACFPDSVIGMVVNPDSADTHFVEYLLQYFKKRLQAKGKGSAQDNINLATFESEKFPFPTLSQQKAISARLDNLSNYVQKLEATYIRKIAALEEFKKSLLHMYLL